MARFAISTRTCGDWCVPSSSYSLINLETTAPVGQGVDSFNLPRSDSIWRANRFSRSTFVDFAAFQRARNAEMCPSVSERNSSRTRERKSRSSSLSREYCFSVRATLSSHCDQSRFLQQSFHAPRGDWRGRLLPHQVAQFGVIFGGPRGPRFPAFDAQIDDAATDQHEEDQKQERQHQPAEPEENQQAIAGRREHGVILVVRLPLIGRLWCHWRGLWPASVFLRAPSGIGTGGPKLPPVAHPWWLPIFNRRCTSIRHGIPDQRTDPGAHSPAPA
jgi:hypothetical protein